MILSGLFLALAFPPLLTSGIPSFASCVLALVFCALPLVSQFLGCCSFLAFAPCLSLVFGGFGGLALLQGVFCLLRVWVFSPRPGLVPFLVLFTLVG